MSSGIVPLEDGTNHDKIKVIDVNECKNCKHHYKSLLKHLGQRKPCNDSYSKQEMNELKFKVKSATNILERKRKKLYYQHNKENILGRKEDFYQKNKQKILRKRKLHYQENKQHIRQKKSDYYHKNSDKVLQKKADYYKKNKKRAKQDDREEYKP